MSAAERTARKQALRASLAKRRRAVGAEARARASRAITERLRALELWTECRRMIAYSALADEISTEFLVQAAAARGLRVAWPRVAGDVLVFAECPPAALEAGASGVLAPPADAPVVVPSEGDLVLVPGVAFDADGGRLGRGGGHYDRVLAGLPPRATSVGIGYDFQLVASVPTEEHDVPVHVVVTDRQTYRRGET